MPTRRAAPDASVAVVLEEGKRLVFASALDWPGWCRAGRGEALALEALAAYAPRYAPVAEAAGVAFPFAEGDAAFAVLERLTGSATTDFGAPGSPAAAEGATLSAADAARRADLVRGSWAVFDAVVADAPAILRKGPRGGGRDRDAIVEHVQEAENAYARKLGVTLAVAAADDACARSAARDALDAALRRARSGTPASAKGWTARYAARRVAWHVLDHAWEIEDRSEAP